MKYTATWERRAKAEGQAEGRLEERQAIALKMLNKNINLETIAEFTGLTIAEIQTLQLQQQQE